MEATIEKIGFRTYPAYKDSGVEWLGEIPEHWGIKRIKHLFIEINERSIDGEEELLSVSQFTGVTKKSDKTAEGELISNAATLEGYKKVYEGDLVSNIMLAWNGSLAFSAYDGITSPAYSVYRVKSNDFNRYFHYLFRTDLYKAEFKKNSSGVIESRLRLYTDDFFRIESILPPLPEQKAIAEFLDKKTALIDKAIQIKEKQIALLQERRQILIQQAVTRGLDPNVKLKDSGVDWIGMIPEHWQPIKLKHLSKFVYDGTHGSYPRVESGFRLLSVRNMKDDQFIFLEDDSRVSFGHFKEISSKFKIIEGDILLAIVGATLGKVAIVKEMEEEFVTQRSVCTIRVNNLINNEYLFFALKSPFFQTYLWNNAGFSAQPGVYLGTIQQGIIAMPSIKEQTKIVDSLKEKCQLIDKSIFLKRREIEKLKEYKSTLINSAVTGKIKV